MTVETAEFRPVITQRAEVDLEESSGVGTYAVRVEEVDGERLVLSAPIFRGEQVPVHLDTPAVVRLFEKRGVFEAPAVSLETSLPPYATLKLRLTGGWTRSQRREAVRVPTAIPTDSVVVMLPEGPLSIKYLTVINLSAAGMLLASHGWLRYTNAVAALGIAPGELRDRGTDARVRVQFSIDDKTSLDLEGFVVRVEEQEGESFGVRIAVQFLGVTKEQEQQLLKHIYDVQRELRRKGVA